LHFQVVMIIQKHWLQRFKSTTFGLALMLLAGLLFTQQIRAQNSEKFKNLESDSSERREFITNKNKTITEQFEKLSGAKNFAKWLHQKLNIEKTLLETPLNDFQTLKVRNHGLGLQTIVSIDSRTEDKVSSETIFQTDKAFQDRSLVIVEARLAPNKNLLGLLISEKGSTDEQILWLIDLQTKKQLSKQISTTDQSWAFAANNQIIYQGIGAEKDTLVVYSLDSGLSVSLGQGWILHEKTNHLLTYQDNRYQIKNLESSAPPFNIEACMPKKVISVHNGVVYLLCAGKDSYNEVRSFAANSEKNIESFVIVPERDFLISRVFFSDETFFVESLRGEDRRIRIHNLQGKRLAQFQLPSCCRLNGIEWIEKNQALKIFLSSAIKEKIEFSYHLKTRKWNIEPTLSMLEKEGISYQSETLLLKSKDGRNFPIRITRRSDLKKDKGNPVLINSYGGFNISGYFEPAYNFLEGEFLRRGGIIVGPALRGGNEVGPLWHREAHFLAKEKTYDDLAATARYFVNENWTELSKVISFGASNGGLTVSATALLNPDHFGLVIPVAGVIDLLGKDRMDAPFGGWSYEYGSSESENETVIEHLKKISPLENTSHFSNTKFFIVTGDSDSRVNPAHSYKFSSSLEVNGAAPAQSQLLTIKNGGHWMTSRSYSSTRAWTSNFYIWGSIFAQSFENPFAPYVCADNCEDSNEMQIPSL